MKRRHESRVVELDSGHQQDFESKLAEALMEMRNQQELQIQMYKDELEKTYNTKVEHQLNRFTTEQKVKEILTKYLSCQKVYELSL